MSFIAKLWQSKQSQVVIFSSTAIALYGYDQGMMSLVNTNYNYLSTMGIAEESPLVGVIVSVYYLGCAVGAVLASYMADWYGRKPSIFACLATASLGNLIMFLAGLGFDQGAIFVMLAGRVVMGLGVGGIDSVVPIFSSELSEDDARGKALAQEFQMNILGLNLAFGINLAVTAALGKSNTWAWRLPIILMQIFPILLMALIGTLPESPRFFVSHSNEDKAMSSLKAIYPDGNTAEERLKSLQEAHKQEVDENSSIGYQDMLIPGGSQFHPTVLTIMGQINQALTGYGAVSVYGPQIFELLGFGVQDAEYITQGNYISYFLLMTAAWILIDATGRRSIMVSNSIGLVVCFGLLTLFAGLAMHSKDLGIPNAAISVPGTVALFVATGNFGVGWLTTIWLIPTEIYPTLARAKGTAVSVIVWGIANFAVTFLTPVMFNGLKFYIFLVFALTNMFAGWWTYEYLPETGGRSFEENQKFFQDAQDAGTWKVKNVKDGEYAILPYPTTNVDEREPLLNRIRDQV